MARTRKDAATVSRLVPAQAPEAFAKWTPRFSEVAAESVLPIDCDVNTVVHTALAAVPAMASLKDTLALELPQFSLDTLDELSELAHAVWFADRALSSSTPENRDALIEEGTNLREGLLIAAEALAFRGLMDKDRVGALRKAHDTTEVGAALVELSELFTQDWARIGAKTAVEKKELERAAQLGPELIFASAASRLASSDTTTDPELIRKQAYTLLVQAYEKCRRAVTYLRWNEGDADTIVPPLPKKRAPRKAKADVDMTGGEEQINGIAQSAALPQ